MMNASANARLAFYVAVLAVLAAVYLVSLALGARVPELVGAILALSAVCADVGGKVVATAVVEHRRRSGHHAPLELDATTPIDPGGPVGKRVREINEAIRRSARESVTRRAQNAYVVPPPTVEELDASDATELLDELDAVELEERTAARGRVDDTRSKKQ